ncbi:MAG: NAD(P)/FAD-dependent oxidoreductase [Candidatus Tectimicrobiota bacterium]
MTETDILIIGGGIVGTSAAYHLAVQGHDVTLLERGDIASEASGVNAGSIGALGWGTMPTLEDYLTMGSLEIFKSLQLDMGYDIEFRQCASLQAIHTEEQLAFARERVFTLRAQGYSIALLSSREARCLEPELDPGLLGCLYMPLRAQADPQKTTRALAALAARSGARLRTHYPVTAIQPQADGRYFVDTAHNDFMARTLILAAGAWCAELGAWLGLRLPIIPIRGQMWATEPLTPRLFHTISSTESALRWHRFPGNDGNTPPELTHLGPTRRTRHLYGRQTRDGVIMFGGDRQAVGHNTTPDPGGIEVNYGQAAEVLPFLLECSIARTWAGLMPFSLDGAPLIGRIPQRQNLYIVSGLASSGFGRGPMAGKLLADYLHSGHPHPVLAEADPARCVTEVAEI